MTFQVKGILREGGPLTAQVQEVFWNGETAVLKDYSRSTPFFRRTAGRMLTRREVKAYRRLEGLAGIPRLLGKAPPDGLLVSRVGGVPCTSDSGPFSPAFFEDLLGALDRLRQRGVLHCDVGRNVLRTSEGRPVLCDLVAVILIPGWLPKRARSRLAGLRAPFDRRAVAKLKQRVAPDLLTGDDKRVLSSKIPFERPVKWLERLWKWATWGRV